MHIICSKTPSLLVQNLAKILNANLEQHITQSFSNQEFFVRIVGDPRKILIEFPKYDSINDSIVNLVMILNSISCYDFKELILLIPYMPYSRQDIRNNIGESLGLKAFADILNNFNIDKIITFDLHSQISEKFFKSEIINITPDVIFSEYLKCYKESQTIVLATDEGGRSRAKKVAEIINCEYIVPVKIRSNNSLEHYFLQEINKPNIIIVDDIIDSGKTMSNLIKELEIKGVKSIDIYATHILKPESIGDLAENELVKRIYSSTQLENLHTKITSCDICKTLLEYL
jgi:ribose-phosphate pyrophosphokinase